jgi:hypothetical protein
MNKQNIFVNVGLVWYSEDEWEKMKQISVDSERLENSFDEWEKMAQNKLAEMRAVGLVGKKVYIRTDDFFIWCKINSLPLNSTSRSKYVSGIMSKRKDK